MADTLGDPCVVPAFKRPRLEFSSERAATESHFDSSSTEQAFPGNLELRKSAIGNVSSSSDSPIDINGGDSGFHDSLLAANDVHSTTVDAPSLDKNVAFDEYVQNGERPPNNDVHSSNLVMNNSSDKDSDENDFEDVASTISELSGLSDMSNFSGQEGKPMNGPYSWVQCQMDNGIDPRSVLMELLPNDTVIPPNLSRSILWRLVLSMLNEPPRRAKLKHINTLDDVVSLVQKCKKIIVLTGAGVSVSCGIPDFRSRNGVYARLSQDYPDLPDPQAMFDIVYFKKDPRPFFKFAKEIYPGQFEPSPSHHFTRTIEKQGKLLRNYTQNIDTLEKAAGIEKVITCHGSFATASCTICRYQVDSSAIKEKIFSQEIPYCPTCSPSSSDSGEPGILKPDIVFFGEGLSDEFHDCMAMDKEECDLLIVMGSSLKVRPVALIPNSLPSHVPQILINREPLSHLSFDVELLGDCDIIIGEICNRLGGDWMLNSATKPLKEITSLPPDPKRHFEQFKTSTMAPEPTAVPGKNFQTIVDSSEPRKDKQRSISPVAPAAEESNSCDYRGLSAIKLDDSQDDYDLPFSKPACNNPASFPPCETNNEPHSRTEEDDDWCMPVKESLALRLPEQTFFFDTPSRYIFEGAEVYTENRVEYSSSDRNSLSDSDSPGLFYEEDDEEDLSKHKTTITKNNSHTDSGGSSSNNTKSSNPSVEQFSPTSNKLVET